MCLGFGIFAVMNSHSQNTKVMVASLFFLLSGVFCFYLIVNGLRKGWIKIKWSVYERAANPVEFWFFLVVFALVGICCFWIGVHHLPGISHPN
jgi:hypothetical protein